MAVYTQRVLLCLDILGFRQAISESESDDEEAERIFQAITVRKDELESAWAQQSYENRRITAFSDSIIISYSEEDLQFLIQDCMAQQISFLQHGFLSRGGIGVGKLYHADNVVFGPAFIKAYDFESKHACVPRVILDPELTNNDENMRRWKDFEHVLPDSDGHYYVNYLSITNGAEEVALAKTSIAKLIENARSNAISLDLKQKYDWLDEFLHNSK